ncbi:MAG: hypothetical protein WBA31_05785 [Candidatus Dormiibacterota bacterium]
MRAACESRQGSLAMVAIGRAHLWTRLRLQAHLSSCVSCREELDELRSVVKALECADPSRVAAMQPSPSPQHPERGLAVPGRSRDGAFRRGRWALGGLVGVVIAVTGGALVWLNVGRPPGAITLHGSQGIQASATLSREGWGTELSLEVKGQPAGHIYHVQMESRSGTWWQAGSYKSESGEVGVHLACGVAPNQVERIWVENSSGRVVLSAEV